MIKIIIVDDQKLIRESLNMILNNTNSIKVISTYSNGAELLDNLQKNMTDIILMDIEMPKMDGITCTKHLKILYPEIKIIILSGHDNEEYIYNAMKYKVNGYILKSTSSKDLIKGIEDVYNEKVVLPQEIAKKVIELFSTVARSDFSYDIKDLHIKNITKTEWKIIYHIGCGETNKEISNILNLSEGTIRNYLTSILHKLNFKDRTQLAIWTVQTNIISEIYK